MLKVMIAEDDLAMADLLEDTFVEGGYEVCGIARTVEDGIELAAHHMPDLVVLDLRLAGDDRGTDIGAWLHCPGGPGILYATGNMGLIDLAKRQWQYVLGKALCLNGYSSRFGDSRADHQHREGIESAPTAVLCVGLNVYRPTVDAEPWDLRGHPMVIFASRRRLQNLPVPGRQRERRRSWNDLHPGYRL